MVGPGSQILLALIARLIPPSAARVLGPTYAEHFRAAKLAGHRVTEVPDVEALKAADLAVVVNPNNPDGRVARKDDLLSVAKALRGRGRLLVVDEAFMDVGPRDQSLGDEVGRGDIVVLRSFGKFVGLPGLRLAFAFTAPDHASRLSAELGPWPVSGAALAIGAAALVDNAWIEASRARLAEAARRLDALLASAGLDIVGGTSLFRLVQTRDAEELFQHLGRAGIFVRRFREHPSWLRVGLPGAETDWQRLEAALATFRKDR